MNDPNESAVHDIDINKSTMIDQIPSHELYASLLGIQLRSTFFNNAVELPICCPNANVHVIPIEARTKTTTSFDLFSQAYYKAITTTTMAPQHSRLKLDKSNKGFQLLRTMGWKEREGGLGRQRQGNLEPIKTVLKQNKRGLGADPRTDAKITHSAQQLASSLFVKRKESKGLRRRRRRREREQEWTKVKDIQFMLRTDVSEQYSQLYQSLHSHPTFRS